MFLYLYNQLYDSIVSLLVRERENCRVACHKRSSRISLITFMANSFVSRNRNYRLFASLFPLAIFQTRARVITKYYVAGDTCLVNSITSESFQHYFNIFGINSGRHIRRLKLIPISSTSHTDTDDIFWGWYSKIGGLSVEGSVSFRAGAESGTVAENQIRFT